MTKADNEALVRRLTDEVWNRGDLAGLEALYAPDRMGRTLPELAATVSSLRAALPDLHLNIDESIAEEDKVVTRWTVRGTHLGRLAGLSGNDVLDGRHNGEDFQMPLVDVNPTGRRVEIGGVSVFHLRDGRVSSSWGMIDRLGLLQQLPVLPAPGLAAI
jgi:predicted ester cyclase